MESSPPDATMTPPLYRKHSFKRQVDSEKRAVLLKGHVLSEVRSSLGSSYPWQSFRDHHSTTHVLQHYHPRCLDNYEYFIGRNTTTMTLNGYRVSGRERVRERERERDGGRGDGGSIAFSGLLLHEVCIGNLQCVILESHCIIHLSLPPSSTPRCRLFSMLRSLM